MPRKHLTLKKHLAAYFAIAFLYTTARLPLPWVRAFTKAIGRVALRVLPRLWRVGMDNLDLAYGDTIPREEKWRILRGAMDNMTIVAAEFSRLPLLNGQGSVPNVDVEGVEFIDDGVGCLLITGHMSNWEFMAGCVPRLGYKITEIVRPLNHPALNAVVDGLRRASGIKTLPKEAAGPEVMRILKSGETVGVLIDQSPRDNGVPVTFFGQPCWATIAPVMIALRAKVPIHFVSMLRQPDGRYILRVQPPFELVRVGEFKADILENSQRCQDEFERIVRGHPEQWLWFHRRWKPRPRLQAEWDARLVRNVAHEKQEKVRLSMSRNYLPGTQIEIINEAELGRIKHVLFDFDGTISLLREGWQEIMAPVCVEMICGKTEPTDAIREAVATMIDETTGIQTIFQMERLVEMIREHGHVPENDIKTPAEYKEVYNDRLMVPVRERLAKLKTGKLTKSHATVRGSEEVLQLLKDRGTTMYVFSGTDRDDVRNEAAQLGVASYFVEIWGAIPSTEDYSKEKVIRELIARHDLHGSEVLAVGDGPVELRNVKEHGGIALGICSNESGNEGWDETKRTRLIRAGADILVPDFSEAEKLVKYLFAEGAA